MYPSFTAASNNQQAHQWLLQEYDGTQNWQGDGIPLEAFESLTAVAHARPIPQNYYPNSNVHHVSHGSLIYRRDSNNAWSSPPTMASLRDPHPGHTAHLEPALNIQQGHGFKAGPIAYHIPAPASSEFSSNLHNSSSAEHAYTQVQTPLPHPQSQEPARIAPAVHPKAYPHAHSPYRSSRLNPNASNLAHAAHPRLPPGPPRRPFHGHSNTQSMNPDFYQARIPLHSAAASLSANTNTNTASASASQLPMQLSSLRYQPPPPLSARNTSLPSIADAIIVPNQPYAQSQPQDIANRENVDPSKQAQNSTPMKIEAPVPVRYHEIAVRSLKTNSASMNKDVGFLSLLNGFVGLESDVNADVGGDHVFGLQSSALPFDGNIAVTREEEEETVAAEGSTQKDASQSESGDAILEDANPTLKARLTTYGDLKLASPDTLIALSEPYLLDWCFDQAKYDRSEWNRALLCKLFATAAPLDNLVAKRIHIVSRGGRLCASSPDGGSAEASNLDGGLTIREVDREARDGVARSLSIGAAEEAAPLVALLG
ncbi:hypothetical protein V5O48_007381 [Marasmius crinis-equi]|uniref:Uncharacterized protein n=1 Tax=Marasmius crinis-equi TaxID=585013 RepID=A0ABR3FH25_9AGAR